MTVGKFSDTDSRQLWQYYRIIEPSTSIQSYSRDWMAV